MSKIQKNHLERAAFIYVRQSTPSQVKNNVQSQRCQYGLDEHARQLGFSNVQVIDDDLGTSGTGHVRRPGFEALLAAVCQGQVGAVFASGASRLARNGPEWHHLLEFCAVVDTLIIDHDGVYDPKHPNDRLLLGLKGMLSEMEVTTFRQRSQEAVRQMARRGEYYVRIPEGYVLRGKGQLEKDPDEQVRRGIELVLEKFRALGSARQVSLWLRQEGIRLPKRVSPKGEQVEFVPATNWRVARLLKDPSYAGAYAHGRSRRQVVLEGSRKCQRKERRPRPEQWEVLLLDHHAGYITWPEYLEKSASRWQERTYTLTHTDTHADTHTQHTLQNSKPRTPPRSGLVQRSSSAAAPAARSWQTNTGCHSPLVCSVLLPTLCRQYPLWVTSRGGLSVR